MGNSSYDVASSFIEYQTHCILSKIFHWIVKNPYSYKRHENLSIPQNQIISSLHLPPRPTCCCWQTYQPFLWPRETINTVLRNIVLQKPSMRASSRWKNPIMVALRLEYKSDDKEITRERKKENYSNLTISQIHYNPTKQQYRNSHSVKTNVEKFFTARQLPNGNSRHLATILFRWTS